MPLQILSDNAAIPGIDTFELWMNKLFHQYEIEEDSITIRVVGLAESEALNTQFLGKEKPTNVLSFAADLPVIAEDEYLGDIIICADVVEKEAIAQNKSSDAHWAHMLVHGILHLRGHDHINDDEAAQMEALEIKMLGVLGFSNPYE